MVDLSKGAAVPNFGPPPTARPKLRHYLGASLFASAAIVCIAGLYLQVAPRRYSSGMILNLPSVSSATQVNVPGLGGTSVQNTSPYASSQDPRENYKIIASSDKVLEIAANIMQRPVSEMGKPKIKVVDGSTVMQVDFLGKTAEEARDKTQAFYQALETRLNELRQQATSDREQIVQRAISSSQQKLTQTQQQVAGYRASTGLNSEIQLRELAANIENLRRQRSELLSEQTQTASRMNALRGNLSLSSRQATDSLKLQADPLFQETVKKYSEVTAELTNTESIYQPDHPAVLQEREKQRELQSLLRQRATELVGSENLNRVSVSMPNGSRAREVLIQDLVVSQVNSRGLTAKVSTLDREIQVLEGKLAQLAQAQSSLDALKRNMQIAETVFSSKLAQLDVDNSDVYAAYPKMQLLSGANLADAPVSPKRTLVMVGAVAAMLLLNSGSLTLWAYRRKNWRQQQGLDGDGFSSRRPGLA
ncbi:hypothetical protein IQ266_14625 [filamentous cyanobacterium LEGE 11480]|uniref:Uncharacterized protein n=1 Tax=Romeriopsis navalis LEGE 11480 TaxID=2777977 RepID=A0A928VNK4_9CYAN|nr:hypothetical protein [Romeriopsis navalis]MBE9030968.1 hypothetical protein [Romeriopsis navalis LEGE 11480]